MPKILFIQCTFIKKIFYDRHWARNVRRKWAYFPNTLLSLGIADYGRKL